MDARALIDELRWRGFIQQITDEPGLIGHLAEPRTLYAGFDPTADSLTIGNLVPIMLLSHFQRAGHRPIVVMGGGTGLIGDPSGKSAERQLMTTQTVAHNVACQRAIFESLLRFEGDNAASITDNADWLCTLSYVDALRDVGKHFSVNMMIQKESVKERLHNREQGISYTEFSYMILQAYDFLRLYEDRGVTLQVGGSDQFGNIVAGLDLIRKHLALEGGGGDAQREAFGMTCPLVTKADGGKFGKTESGAVWLTAARTSPYAFYQFWLNTADADVFRFLKLFTFRTRDEIGELEAMHAANPGAREPHRALASDATALLHGAGESELAEKASKALFSGDIVDLPERTLRDVFAEVPSSEVSRDELGAGLDPVDLLVNTGLAKSKREAREFVANGSVSINSRKVGEGDRVDSAWLLHGSVLAVRRGKKTWHLVRVEN